MPVLEDVIPGWDRPKLARALQACDSRVLVAFYSHFRPILVERSQVFGISRAEGADAVETFLGDMLLKLCSATELPKSLHAYVFVSFKRYVARIGKAKRLESDVLVEFAATLAAPATAVAEDSARYRNRNLSGETESSLLAEEGVETWPNLALEKFASRLLGELTPEDLLDQGTCPTALCPGDSPAFPGKFASAYGETAPGPHQWYGTLIGGMTDASGYLYRRNRYADPKTGRFTQEDPIGLAGGLNLYGFANGDPVNFGDPFGLCPWCVGAGIGAATGAGYTIVDNYLNGRPLTTNLLYNTLSGAVAGATLGYTLGISAGAATAVVVNDVILFEGGRQALRAELRTGLKGLSAGQAANIARQLGKGAVDNIRITPNAGGAITAELTREGRNGYQILTKIINEAGETVRMSQSAYDKAKRIVHGEVWK
jgi:RHS repeat-associated protein